MQEEAYVRESTIQESTIQGNTIRKNIIQENARQWKGFLAHNINLDIRRYERNLKRFNRGGLFLFTFFLILALLPVLFAPYSPTERFMPYEAPSTAHLLGTNDIGNDILSELVYGARISMMVGFASACISTLIGLMIGLFSGYFRGTLDELLMGFTDVVLIIPKIPLIIILGAFLRPSIWTLILVLGLLSWESIARVVRSKTLQIREAGYVKSARCMGFSSVHIMASDIFPNLFHVLLPKFMLATASAMISEASLSFLGLGDISMKSWGIMLSFAFSRGGFIRDMWWWYLPPGICITLCVMSIALIGFGFEGKEKENGKRGVDAE
ncbi:ABC transporter permease [Methanosarcina sp. KYL-1]|uniref:ABC transporter permease n=1 Tax=Methanosarcina sp. KYL-1 TaxID=2602068 RepID=UPI0021011FE6|nr:ABC transporter permease [Methanosarcina sp. KYL-1]MCQ1536043.1 ABC transporter permease [Methanosarcina sp. KYL-1]